MFPGILNLRIIISYVLAFGLALAGFIYGLRQGNDPEEVDLTAPVIIPQFIPTTGMTII